VKVGLPDVDGASGMVTVNQAVASRVGNSGFATNDLAERTVADWFEHLAHESGSNTSSLPPLSEFIRRPNGLSVVGALEADAVRDLENVAAAKSITVIAPEPVATADVRLWASDGRAVEDAIEKLGADRLAAALDDTGWRTPKGQGGLVAPAGAASIEANMASLDTALPGTAEPENSGLPSPGTVFTVNTRWKDSQ